MEPWQEEERQQAAWDNWLGGRERCCICGEPIPDKVAFIVAEDLVCIDCLGKRMVLLDP